MPVGLKGSLGSGLRPLGVLALAVALCLSGCGGGAADSGAENISLSLSPNTLSIATNTLQSAPISNFEVDALGLPPGIKVYVKERHSSQAVWQVQSPGDTLPASFAVQFLPPASIGPGTYHDQITVSMCMDAACTQPVKDSPQTVDVTYTVTKEVYAITGVSPASVQEQSSAFTLTVTGSNFTPQSVVRWNGATRTTHFVSSTELTADIPATDTDMFGAVPVTVNDPTLFTTNAETFTVIRPAMALGSISPASVAMGGLPFTLTVLGDGFGPASSVQWNGTALSTTYVSSKELLAQVPAADIGSLGTAAITVGDSTGTPAAVGPQSLAIAAASKDAVSYQINGAHSGAVNFNNVNLPFPSTATWTVDVGGVPSYALITQGEVILSVATGTGSELIALDQATGNTVWGPIALPGGFESNPVYEDGRVFVVTPIAGSPSLVAFDAATGNQDWSVPNSNFDQTIPAVGDGLVFVAGDNPGTLYAFDESTGSQAWTQSIAAGSSLTAAVTADGVYVADEIETFDFRPATGELIWKQGPNGSGGTGALAIAANGLIYSADMISFPDSSIYDAESGTKQGTYTARTLPRAFSTSMDFFLQSGNDLEGITLSDNMSQWSFAGDGTLATAPIAVNQYVFIAGDSPNLYAIDSTTGNQVWTVNLGAVIGGPHSGNLTTGLAAGDGLLVVSAGTKVFAFTLSTNP